VLARQGRFQALTVLADDTTARPEVTSLPRPLPLDRQHHADPDARMLEFGRGLQFPVDTAIKTGTSTDYRGRVGDCIRLSTHVAVWMGNLDGAAMDGVTAQSVPRWCCGRYFSS